MLQKKDYYLFNVFACGSTTELVEAKIFSNPHQSFHLRELSRLTDSSTTAVSKSIEELQEQRIIKVDQDAITKEIIADLESPTYRYHKLIYNLHELFKNNIISLFKIHFHNPECIVLFGSFAKGEDIEESDIDILVISDVKNPEYPEEFNKHKKRLEKLFNRRLNLHILPSLDKSKKEFRNAVANGIVLYGYLKVL